MIGKWPTGWTAVPARRNVWQDSVLRIRLIMIVLGVCCVLGPLSFLLALGARSGTVVDGYRPPLYGGLAEAVVAARLPGLSVFPHGAGFRAPNGAETHRFVVVGAAPEDPGTPVMVTVHYTNEGDVAAGPSLTVLDKQPSNPSRYPTLGRVDSFLETAVRERAVEWAQFYVTANLDGLSAVTQNRLPKGKPGLTGVGALIDPEVPPHQRCPGSETGVCVTQISATESGAIVASVWVTLRLADGLLFASEYDVLMGSGQQNYVFVQDWAAADMLVFGGDDTGS